MKNKFYINALIMAFVISTSQVNAQVACPTPSGLTATNVTSSTATLAWISVGNNAYYNVQYRISSNTTWTTITSQAASVNLTNLTCNAQYQWRVRSACPGTNGTVTFSAYSASVTFNTLSCNSNLCGVPTGLFSSNITATSATLHWNSTGATSYKVRCRVTGTTAWTIKSTGTNTKILTALTPSTAYQWQVRSRCVDPTTGVITFSAWSSTSVFQTSGSTSCAAPTGLTAVINSANAAQLAWNATGAVSYNIRYKPANTAMWATTTSNTNSKTLTQVLGGTPYEWQVQGVCQGGGGTTLSAWSASAFFTTNAPLTVLPNPASDKISVTFQSSTTEEVHFIIKDVFGNSYAAVTKSSAQGTNQYELNVSDLKNGVYYLEINGAEGRQTQKFYVQH